MQTIYFYNSKEPYGFLNNYTRTRIFIFEKWYPTVEHAYQAQKATNAKDHELIRTAPTPKDARILGQQIKMIDGWDNIKIGVMRACLIAKFTQHPQLLVELISTENSEIVEDSPIDSFWGIGEHKNGQNNLGKLLVEVRNLLNKN